MRRHEPPTDYWRAAKARGFVEIQEDRFSGALAGHACSIAMVPIAPGALGVLTKVDVDSALWGNLYRLNGVLAKHMFDGGSPPQTPNAQFASTFRVRADGAFWMLDDKACTLMEDLHLEYIQAIPTSLSLLCVSEVPPDELTLTGLTSLIQELVTANRKSE
jgi:hypothetical protein